MTSEDSVGSNERVELGPSTEATRVRDSVLIKERRGNLVKKIFIDVEDWEKIGELFGRSVKPGSDGGQADV